MYYVPDGTEKCGFYECEECKQRFLDLRIAPRILNCIIVTKSGFALVRGIYYDYFL